MYKILYSFSCPLKHNKVCKYIVYEEFKILLFLKSIELSQRCQGANQLGQDM